MGMHSFLLIVLVLGLSSGADADSHLFSEVNKSDVYKENIEFTPCNISNHTMTCPQIPERIPPMVTEVFATDQGSLNKGIFSHESWGHVSLVSITGLVKNSTDAPFIGLENVTELRLNFLRLQTVPPNFFAGLNNTLVLSVFDFKLVHNDKLQEALQVPGTLPRLQELNYDSGQTANLPVVKFNNKCVNAFEKWPLHSVRFHRVILDVPVKQLFNMFNVSKLDLLNISRSVVVLHSCFAVSNSLQLRRKLGLKVFDMSGATISNIAEVKLTLLSIFMFSVEHFYADNYDHMVYTTNGIHDLTEVPIQLKSVHLRNNNLLHLNRTILLNPNNSIYLLDISQNKIGYICHGFLASGIHAKEIYLSKNRLFKMQNLREFSDLFSTLHVLEVLDLSDNNLSTLPKYIFRNNTRLKVLNLSKNILSSITFDMNELYLLNSLDLRMNKIHTISGGELSALEQFVDWKWNLLNISVVIQFDGNPLQCTCEYLGFVRWLAGYMAQLNVSPGSTNCTYEGKILAVDHSIVNKTNYLCKRMTIIIVSVSLSIVLSVLLVFTSVCVYKIRRSCIRSSKREKFVQMFVDGNLDQKFMAFVAYASEDEERVSRNFLINAEDMLQRCMESGSEMLRTGDHFRPGCLIVEETYRLIEMSCVFIAMVSNAFCTRDYCKAEIEEACNQNKPIILVFLEHVDENTMTPYLQEVFKRNSRAKLVRLENGTYQLIPTLDILCDSIIQLATDQIGFKKKTN